MMDSTPIDRQETPLKLPNSEVHVMDFLSLVAKYKWAVVSFSLIGGILFFAFTYVMPFTYSGLTTLVPPEKNSNGNQLLSFLSGSSALDMMKGAENPALDMFKNILDSRTVAEEVAADSAIRHYFASWDTSRDMAAFSSHDCLTSEPLRNGIFNVQIDIKTHWFPSAAEKEEARKLVPHMASLFVHHLDKYNRERLMTSARNTRIFVEGEYKTRLLQLDTAYGKLQAFQQEHKAIALPEQLTAAVTSAAMLASQEQQLEIEIAAAQRELSSNAGRVELLRSQLEETQRQLKKYDEGGVGDYVVALKNVPELTRELAGLTREVKMLETVTAYLRQQLEQERISEQRDLPTLTVLDSAMTPDRKSSPKRSVALLLGLFSGFLFSIIFVIWKRFQESVRVNPEEHHRYLSVINNIRGRKA
jgi:tyrosine-protein kinase Etk/Wzc